MEDHEISYELFLTAEEADVFHDCVKAVCDRLKAERDDTYHPYENILKSESGPFADGCFSYNLIAGNKDCAKYAVKTAIRNGNYNSDVLTALTAKITAVPDFQFSSVF